MNIDIVAFSLRAGIEDRHCLIDRLVDLPGHTPAAQTVIKTLIT
jgi:hypothetical protein